MDYNDDHSTIDYTELYSIKCVISDYCVYPGPGTIKDSELRWTDGTIGTYELLSATAYRTIDTTEIFFIASYCLYARRGRYSGEAVEVP